MKDKIIEATYITNNWKDTLVGLQTLPLTESNVSYIRKTIDNISSQLTIQFYNNNGISYINCCKLLEQGNLPRSLFDSYLKLSEDLYYINEYIQTFEQNIQYIQSFNNSKNF